MVHFRAKSLTTRNFKRIIQKIQRLINNSKKKIFRPFYTGEEILYLSLISIVIKTKTRATTQTDQLMLILTPNFLDKSRKKLSTEYSYLLNPIAKLQQKFGTYNHSIYTYEKFGTFRSKYKFLSELSKCQNTKILLSSWNAGNGTRGQPSPIFFIILKKFYKTTDVYRIGWDTVSKKYWEQTNSFDFLKTDFVIDNPVLWGLDKKRNPLAFEKVKIVNFPCDLDLFSQKKFSLRSNDVCFMGSVGSYRGYRAKFIFELEKLPIKKIINATSNRENFTSDQDYFRNLGDSKISLNFSGSVHFDQLKGRVWESLFSGCLLLESSNIQTRYFFVPNLHFIEFQSIEDMIDKISYLLKNQKEMEDIAENGRQRAIFVKNNLDIFNNLFK